MGNCYLIDKRTYPSGLVMASQVKGSEPEKKVRSSKSRFKFITKESLKQNFQSRIYQFQILNGIQESIEFNLQFFRIKISV